VSEINELLELAVRIAKDAGALLSARPEHLSIDTKSSDIDIVTQMDRASEKLIFESILAARPDDGIIGEEGANRPSSSGYTWVIDPIDGTVNYFYNMAGWSVSIAVKDQKGTAVGVVYSPTTNSLFTATRGGGSYLNGRKLKCNEPIELDRALIATGFAYSKELRETQIAQFNDLILKIRDYRRWGAFTRDIKRPFTGLNLDLGVIHAYGRINPCARRSQPDR